MAGKTFFNDIGLNIDNEPVMSSFENNQINNMSSMPQSNMTSFGNNTNMNNMQPMGQSMSQGNMGMNQMTPMTQVPNMNNPMNQGNMMSMEQPMMQGNMISFGNNANMNNMQPMSQMGAPNMIAMGNQIMQGMDNNSSMVCLPSNDNVEDIETLEPIETLDLTSEEVTDGGNSGVVSPQGMMPPVQQNNMMNNVPNNMNGQVSPVMNNEMNTLQTFNGVNQMPNMNPMAMDTSFNDSMQQSSIGSMNNQQVPNMNPMMQAQTGANQGFINPGMQNPMNQGMMQMQQPADNSMMLQQGANASFAGAPQPVVDNSPITPIQPVGGVVSDTANNIKMKPKLNVNFKNIFIGGVALLFTVMIVLTLVFSKTVTCTLEKEIQGIPTKQEVKANIWFNKVNKITKTTIIDLSSLPKDTAKQYLDYYKNLKEEGTSVSIKGDKITITMVLKVTKKGSEMTLDEFEKAQTSEESFVCK